MKQDTRLLLTMYVEYVGADWTGATVLSVRI